MRDKNEKYPKPTPGSLLCQCGGQLITERTDTGNGENVHDIFRVHCAWCPMSTIWTCNEASCLDLLFDGMPIRRNSGK